MRALLPLALLPVPVLFLLTGCNDTPGQAPHADTELARQADAPPPPVPAPAAAARSEPASATVTANRIPQAMQGRWGLVAADCEPGRADAKGLLVIGPGRLEFYESVGTLGLIESGTDSRIRARFAFTGEGMAWQREQTLELANDGQTLIRREFGDDAAPGPLRYTRCG